MNISTSTVATRRRKARANQVDEEENAAELKLGPEFQLDQIDNYGNPMQLTTLNVSEARILIRAALKERMELISKLNGLNESVDNNNNSEPDDYALAKMAIAPGANEVLTKTLDYLSTFSRFKDAETCTAAESLLKGGEGTGLHPFEIAQLGSLACEDIDEAITLIPSLNDKKDDVDLQRILDELNRLEANYS
ncbi:hypothetical protein CANARDRAFT_29459 [[Candida] arabinofermentans NRRL YB-2248]|uniref:RNA polymerase Rpb4/RPC9 core domain-containing protein n=1 Tax=[Candida] arabinofermentans NRRL YB-2248 TaxID=983967 RepID=A0A1E4SWZ1_9ASCO|nr:hypothetical protein CANARDRAFT_29459 [[Candida] arabinofermentans NRRL YB-2248]